MNTQKNDQNYSIGLLLLRGTIGILILFHGIANFNSDYAFIKSLLEGLGIPSILAYGVFIGEIVAPVLLIIGYKTKLNSLIIAFNFLLAILLAHSSDIFSINQFGGWGIELQALYLFGSMALFFTGAGQLSLDLRSNKKTI